MDAVTDASSPQVLQQREYENEILWLDRCRLRLDVRLLSSFGSNPRYVTVIVFKLPWQAIVAKFQDGSTVYGHSLKTLYFFWLFIVLFEFIVFKTSVRATIGVGTRLEVMVRKRKFLIHILFVASRHLGGY